MSLVKKNKHDLIVIINQQNDKILFLKKRNNKIKEELRKLQDDLLSLNIQYVCACEELGHYPD